MRIVINLLGFILASLCIWIIATEGHGFEAWGLAVGIQFYMWRKQPCV